MKGTELRYTDQVDSVLIDDGASQMAPMVSICQCKNMQVHALCQEDPLEEAWQPIPVFLPGESPWTEEPGGIQSMGSRRTGHN